MAKPTRTTGGAPGLVNKTAAGAPALNPVALQAGNRYVDPNQALREWRSDLSSWFDDPRRVAAFSLPVLPEADA